LAKTKTNEIDTWREKAGSSEESERNTQQKKKTQKPVWVENSKTGVHGERCLPKKRRKTGGQKKRS